MKPIIKRVVAWSYGITFLYSWAAIYNKTIDFMNWDKNCLTMFVTGYLAWSFIMILVAWLDSN